MAETRIAIMGAGNIAHKFCDAARQTAGAEVVAVASKSAARAKAFAAAEQIGRWYADYAQMLREEKPTLVYIATTINDHARLSAMCVAAGVPVLCEKAMFTGAADARTILGEARRRGVFAMEAMWSRFLPAERAAKQWLAEGRIGRISLAEATIGYNAPSAPDNRYFNPQLGGGAAFDMAVYGIELLTWLLEGGVTRASAAVMRGETGVDVAEVISMKVGGVPASVRASLIAPLREELVIHGERGTLVIPTPHYAREAFLYDAEGRETARFIDTETRNGFTYELAEALRCLRAGEMESPVIPHRDTIACAEIFDLITDALKEEP